jgi:hypothetical protein
MGSVQEKFTFMLQERLNKLEDLFENNLTSIHPDTESYQNLICPDIGCIAAAVFIKIIVAKEDSINEIIEIIRNFKGVKIFTYHSGKLNNYSENIPEDSSYEYKEDLDQEENDDAFIIQVLVCFKHSIVASRIGVALCKCLESIKVELQPIYDFRVGNAINQDTGLFQYYYYNIVALQNNKHPNIINEDYDVNWYKPDGTYTICFFEDTNYDGIFKKLENRNINFSIWPHKYKNY